MTFVGRCSKSTASLLLLLFESHMLGDWRRGSMLMLVTWCKVELSSPVTGASDSGMKALVGLMLKCSCLKIPSCCL